MTGQVHGKEDLLNLGQTPDIDLADNTCSYSIGCY